MIVHIMEYYTIIKELELSLNLEVFLWDSKWIKQSAVKQEKVLEDYIFFLTIKFEKVYDYQDLYTWSQSKQRDKPKNKTFLTPLKT